MTLHSAYSQHEKPPPTATAILRDIRTWTITALTSMARLDYPPATLELQRRSRLGNTEATRVLHEFSRDETHATPII